MLCFFEGPSLPIALRPTREAPTPTPSRGRAPRAPVPTLGHSVVPILVPTHVHLHTQEEAKGRVVTIALGQGHTVITVQGQGHPRTEDTIHGPGLQCLGASLPLSGLYLKGKEKGSILTGTEKFHHTI